VGGHGCAIGVLAPLILGLTGGGTYMVEVAEKSWQALGQNAVTA